MKITRYSILMGLTLLACIPAAQAQLTLGIVQSGSQLMLAWPAAGTNFFLQSTTNLARPNWLAVSNASRVIVGTNITVPVVNSGKGQFFRLCNTNVQLMPAGMVLISAGSFTMGNSTDPDEGYVYEVPTHTVSVSAFSMDSNLVSYSQWKQVYTWAITHGYAFDNAGSGKTNNHPVQTIDWYDTVKWCNARSEMESRTPAYYTSDAQTTVYRSGQLALDSSSVKWNAGYRLPTEAEWEYAARGGLTGQRFPWGNTISWSQANYYAEPLALTNDGSAYDLAPAIGYDLAFNDTIEPYTSPVSYFGANGYGLYDIAGNVFEWCWDLFGSYTSASQTDPRGPTTGTFRIARGGFWQGFALFCRVSYRGYGDPTGSANAGGFRCVLPQSQ
jgi:formylglycine-generating enzyme required for sulfatase activity